MPGGLRSPDAVDHGVERIALGHLLKPVTSQTVERDVDPFEAGIGQLIGAGCEQRAIGGEREIDAQRCQPLDQQRQMGPHERFTTGQTDRIDPKSVNEDRRDTGELLERADLLPGLPHHPFGWHAIGTAEIAPIRHRNAQVTVHTLEPVNQRHARLIGRAVRGSGVRVHRYANGNTASVFSIPQQGFRDSIAASRVMVEGLPGNAQDNNATATLPPGDTPSPSGSQAIAFAAADAAN